MELPVTASPTWPWLIFALALLVFHLLFIYILRFDKLSWKRTDYVWLGLTALGLITAVGDVRRMVAPVVEREEVSYCDVAYAGVRDRALALTGAAVCRKFVRSEFSPSNTEETQKEYDKACAYAHSLYSRLPPQRPKNPDTIKLPIRLRISDPILKDFFRMFDTAWKDYVASSRRIDESRRAEERTDAESALAFFSPFLLAVALALRITKVSGEIRLERLSSSRQ